MKKTTLWTIKLSIGLGFVGWISVVIEEIISNSWDGFIDDITHWEHYIPVIILVVIGIIGGYTRGRMWEESEEKYRSLFDRIPVGLYRITPEGEIIAGNSAFLSMLNISFMDEVKKKNLLTTDLYTEYPRDRFLEL